jgi:replicative DNA helicase
MVFSQGVKLVVVDYLQLIENAVKGEPRHMQVAGISRALKRLAMDLNIPILALSQLNKNPEERVGGKIHLSDMRESEAISQDADYVIFVHRPVLMGKDDKDHLELAKNRYGETISRVNVIYDKARNTYSETNGNS